MSPLRVSEKTLELNVCAETLIQIRSYPGCSRAFWIGMKQSQEAKNGLDELIHNLPISMHLALQFKAPKSEPRDQLPYRYTINDRQNSSLLRLAMNRPEAVYYVLAHYNTFTRMRLNSPNLLRDTYLLKVYDLRGLPASRNKLGTHKVETNPPFALVESEPIELKLVSASDLLGSVLGSESRELKDTLISHELLKEWLSGLITEAKGDKRVIGQRLRGFSTFCIS